jgi:hypothetical protein
MLSLAGSAGATGSGVMTGTIVAVPPATSAPASSGAMTTSLPGAPPGVAAKIGDHVISLDDVLQRAMRQDASNVVDRMVNNYLIDQACSQAGITIPETKIDDEISGLAKAIAPTTLEEGLKAHHESLDNLKDDIRHQLERLAYCSKDAPQVRMNHVRLILVEVPPPGAPVSGGHTDDDALKIIKDAQRQLAAGKPFAEVAKAVSEDPDTKNKGGDFGVLWSGAPYDSPFVNAAMTLAKKGDMTTDPVKVYLGYEIIQVVSTSDDKHTPDEEPLYAKANDDYHNQVAQSRMQQCTQDLRSNATIVDYIPD